MEVSRAQLFRELLRGGLIATLATLLLLTPALEIVPSGHHDAWPWSIGAALLVGLMSSVAEDLKLGRRGRRSGGLRLRIAVRSAIRAERLPDDADPETWTYPVAQRLKAVRSAPWEFGSAAAVMAALLVYGVVQHRAGAIPIGMAAFDVVALLVLLVDAIRDRTGRRGLVLAGFLDELDARADAAPVAG